MVKGDFEINVLDSDFENSKFQKKSRPV